MKSESYEIYSFAYDVTRKHKEICKHLECAQCLILSFQRLDVLLLQAYFDDTVDFTSNQLKTDSNENVLRLGLSDQLKHIYLLCMTSYEFKYTQ